jgi:hypothetical protein
MAKIPVGRTIAHAYRFAFGNFLGILRTIWLPLLLQLAMTVPVAARAGALFQGFAGSDPGAMSQFASLIPLYLVLILLFFVQMTAVTQLALGKHQPGSALFYFPIGKAMWRLVGGFVLAVLAILAVAAVYVIVLFIGGALLKAATAGMSSRGAALTVALLVLAVLLIGYGGLIFLAVRFLFLLAPVNIVRQKLGVLEAWELSHRNFWRAFLVILSILLPMVAVEYILVFSAVGFPPIPHAGVSPQAFQAARLAWNIAMIQSLVRYWYVALPLLGVLMVLYFGAGCAAQVFAYRALTEDEASVPVAADRLPD